MAVEPIPTSLLSNLPPEEAFTRVLAGDSSDGEAYGQAMVAARQALQTLSVLKASVLAQPDEFFLLDPSDPACAPPRAPLPSSIPYKRLRSRQPYQNPLQSSSSSSLNTRPPVLVPPTPASLSNINSDPFSSHTNLEAYLTSKTAEPIFANARIRVEVVSLDEKPRKAQLKVTIGTVGWGFLTFAERRRDSGGLGMVVIRAAMFAPNEVNKGKAEMSSYRSFVELSTHLNSLQVSLPDLLHRLPAYVDLLTRSCTQCNRVLRRGVFPGGRAWQVAPSTSDAAATGQNGMQVDGEDGLHEAKEEGGSWIGFHLDCWNGLVDE